MPNLVLDAAGAPAIVREKRLVLRVLAIWRDACEEDVLPRVGAFTPSDTGDDADHVYLLDVLYPAGPRFTYVGAALRVAGWPSTVDAPLDHCPPESVLSLASYRWQEIVDRRVPITRGGPGFNDGEAVLYRSIMAPLVDETGRVSAILGAANWRLVTAGDGVPSA